MAERLDPVAADAVGEAQLGPDVVAVDIGCGTGNAALRAAATGAGVIGIDPSGALLELAAQRARALELVVDWRAGSAERLPLEAASADVALSVFGLMYTPDAARAVAELDRVLAPGGCAVLTAWTADSLMTLAGRVAFEYLESAPAGAEGPPSRWGDPGFLDAAFGGRASLEHRRDCVAMQLGDPHAAAKFWLTTAGHVQSERPRLERSGRWEELDTELTQLFAAAAEDGRYRFEFLMTRATFGAST